jgi:hypothetical protein
MSQAVTRREFLETVRPALEELREIYRARGAENEVRLIVTPEAHDEMDVPALFGFLSGPPENETAEQ